VFLQEIGCADVVLEGASFVLRDPDADKITGQVVALRQRMQGLARNVFLGDLTLEFDAVGAVLSHGFHPWKPGKFRSIPNLQSVHRLGCTPVFDMLCHHTIPTARRDRTFNSRADDIGVPLEGYWSPRGWGIFLGLKI